VSARNPGSSFLKSLEVINLMSVRNRHSPASDYRFQEPNANAPKFLTGWPTAWNIPGFVGSAPVQGHRIPRIVAIWALISHGEAALSIALAT
jgi:hypothetical protein